MIRNFRTLSAGLALAAALVAASLTGCSSSSSKKDTQVPSEMLGPEGTSPANNPPVESAPDPAATLAPAATPAPATLTASEQAYVTELTQIMKDVSTQFERLVVALEGAGKDCKKAAAALAAGERESAPIDQKMNAFKTKLEQGGQPSDALMSELRKITLSAFPAELRTRAEATVDGLDKQCANDPDFKKAKAAAAAKQQGG